MERINMNTMKITFRFLVIAFVLVGMVVGTTAFAKEEPKDEGKNRGALFKTAAYQPERYQVLNINNLWSWHREDGQSNHSPTGDNGVFFPRGTSFVIYQDGMVYGSQAYLDADYTQPAPFSQRIRVGGGTYTSQISTFEGWITGYGASAQPADKEDARARIYRIRRDWQQMSEADLKRDAAESNEIGVSSVSDAQVAEIVGDYAWSWNNWPVDLGAPYIDRNGNGVYDPPPAGFHVKDLIEMGYDEPGIAGADPNSPADQVLWTVYNDLNSQRSLDGLRSEPTGMEVQMTMWGYKRTDALGNIYFKKWRFINKGGVDIDESGTKGIFHLDSMYVCQWSDPDLGSFSDDLVGCDTVLSLGFVYNGNAVDTDFRKFNLPPPSGGYDFLQGPAVPDLGGEGIFDLKVKPDIKNLGMTGFSYFSAGSPYSDPGGGYDTRTIQWYKMLRGFAPLSGDDVRYNHPPGVEPGPFPLAGNPVTQEGHVDGQGEDYSFVPGDRRLLIITGPFQMAPGDTQEVVVAFIAGLGADRLSSVAVMKFNDRFAQNTYDALFQVPAAPSAPDVNVSQLDGQIVLEWGSNVAQVADTEEKVNQPGNFTFEGYNVYMVPSATSSPADGKLVATYDKLTDPSVVLDERFDLESGQILNIPVHFGSNSGLNRFYGLNRDELNDIDKLNNGQEYFLAVTSYSVSTIPGYLPSSLESEFKVLTVVPESRELGQTFNSELGTDIPVSQTGGAGNAVVTATVVDPKAVTPATYEVEWDADQTWKLSRGGTVLFSGQENYALNNDYLIADGIVVKVGQLGFEAPVTYFNAEQTVDADPTDAGLTLWGDGLLFGYDDGWNVTFWGGGTTDVQQLQLDVELRFTGVLDGPVATGGSVIEGGQIGTLAGVSGGSGGRSINDHPNRPAGAPATGSFLQRIPFEAWEVDDPANPRQINVAFYDRGADHSRDAGSVAYHNTWNIEGRDYITFINTDYDPTKIHELDDPNATWAVFFEQQGDASYTTGDVFLIEYGNPIVPGSDKFSFSSAGFESTSDNALAKQEISRVGVFPNPYYAFNPQEVNRLSRFVTFNNLPDQATIRIFNLAGQLIRTIDHQGGQFERWNLLNQSNFPVASGMYIAHIDMDNVGVRILKLAVVQEAEILETF